MLLGEQRNRNWKVLTQSFPPVNGIIRRTKKKQGIVCLVSYLVFKGQKEEPIVVKESQCVLPVQKKGQNFDNQSLVMWNLQMIKVR